MKSGPGDTPHRLTPFPDLRGPRGPFLQRRRGIFWLGCTVVLYVLTCCDVSYSNHDYYTLIIGPLGRVVDLTMTFFSAVFSLKVKANLVLIISPIASYSMVSVNIASHRATSTTPRSHRRLATQVFHQAFYVSENEGVGIRRREPLSLATSFD